MANAQFILKTTVWDGDEVDAFKRLTVDAQHLYVLLCSQKSISLCGVIALAVKRWASLSAGTTPKRVRRALGELVAARYVIVDEDTEEVLVRTYVTHAGALKIPNVVVGLCRDYTEILSLRLRSVVMAQIRAEHLVGIRQRHRIPAQFVAEYETAKREPFPLLKACETPEGLPQPLAEPLPEPFSDGSGEGMPIQPTTDNRQPTNNQTNTSVARTEQVTDTPRRPGKPGPRRADIDHIAAIRTEAFELRPANAGRAATAAITRAWAWALDEEPDQPVVWLADAIRGARLDPHYCGHNDRGTVFDGWDNLLRDAARIERHVRLARSPGQRRPTLNRTGQPSLPAHTSAASRQADVAGQVRAQLRTQPDRLELTQ